MPSISVCRFTRELSIAAGANGFRIYGGPTVVRFRNLEDVAYDAPMVYLDDGLVHLFGNQNVYEIRFSPEVVFTVTKIGDRYI